jgi:hypothetical protein
MGQSLLSGVIGGVSGAISGSKWGAPGAIVLGTVGAVLGFAGTYLAKKELNNQLSATSSLTPAAVSEPKYSGYTVNSKGSALHHQVIYGKTKVGGVVVFDDATGTNNEYLSRIIAFAGHEVEDFEEIFLDNYKVTSLGTDGNVATVQEVDEKGDLISGTSSTRFSGLVKIRKIDGGHTSSLDGQSLSNFSSKWTSNHILRGIAHLAIVFKADLPTSSDDVSAYPNGLPVVTALVKGKKVYDPRTSTTAWSDNPALIIRDFLTNTSYGLSEDEVNIDDDRIETAADICDETVTTDSSTRYTCNGAWLTSAVPVDLLGQFVATCAGTVWYAQGKWRLKAGKYTTPVLNLNEDDLRSPLSVSTRHSRRDNFNGVRGVFKGPASNYQPTDYPLVTDASFVTADGGEESLLDLPLPFTDSPGEAQRIANIALERNRSQITLTGAFGLRAFQLEVGDIITLTNSRLVYTNEIFEVVHWAFGVGEDQGLDVNLVLRAITTTAYDEYADAAFESENTDFPNPNANLTISSLTVSGSGKTLGDGSFLPNAIVSWGAPGNPFVTSYDVEWRQTSETDYNSTTTPETSIEIGPFVGGVQYLIRVRAVTEGGSRGPFVTTNFTGGGDTTAPAAPSGVSASGEFQAIRVEWTNPADLDFSHVEIYEHTSNNSGAATKIAISTGDHYYRTNLGLGVTRYYWLKSVDYSGNTSGFSSVAFATSEGVGSTSFVNDVTALFEDQGLHYIEDVSSLPASGTTGQQVFNTSDGKLYRWSGSSWETVVGDVGDINFSDLSGTLADAQIAVGSINGTKITNQTIDSPQITAGAITSGKIVAGAITTGKIATDAINSSKIVANAVTGDKISGNTITGDKIVANTITGGLLAASGIITNTAQINNSVIESANIKNAEVGTLKIAGDAVGVVDPYNSSTISVSYNMSSPTTLVNTSYNFAYAGEYIVMAIIEQSGGVTSSSEVIYTLIMDGTIMTLGSAEGPGSLTNPVMIGSKSVSSGNRQIFISYQRANWSSNSSITNSVKVRMVVWRKYR